MQKSSTVFITGSGRSGTNITKAIFAQHSQCATLPFEYRFTIDPGGVVDFINQYSSSWSPFMADSRLRNLESFLLSLANRNDDEYAMSNWLKKVDRRAENITPYAYAGWELEKWMPGYKKFVSRLMTQLTDYKYQSSWPGSDSLASSNQMYFGVPKSKEELIVIFSEFLQNCFRSILELNQKEIFVEDNTWSLLFGKDILDMVPDGKVLHVMRDPRDVVASLIRQRWTPSDFDQILLWYKSVMETWQTQKAKLNKNQFVEIRLEDIISDTEKTIKSTCEFLGMEYESDMVGIDLSKSNAGRYKSEFTEDQVAILNTELDHIMKTYGY